MGLADRLDTLVGLFAVGIRPSGAADPWGLRRAALSVVLTLVGKGLSLSLTEAIAATAEQLPVQVPFGVQREVLDYIVGRYQGYLRDQGYDHAPVLAVLNARGSNPYLALQTLHELVPYMAEPDWGAVLDQYAYPVRPGPLDHLRVVQRAEALFLEVDETNAPAIALYRRLGFHQVGHRPNYYRSVEHGPTGALVMRRDLR